MTRCLQTTGQGYFEEVDYDKPTPTSNQIEVQAIMTGVCRSDIDMYFRKGCVHYLFLYRFL